MREKRKNSQDEDEDLEVKFEVGFGEDIGKKMLEQK